MRKGGSKLIPSFEWKHELYYIICLLVIPVICCIIFYFKRPKLIWITPLFIFCAFILVSIAFFPYFFEDILKGEYDFTTIYWLLFFVPVQIISALFFTGLTHIIITIRGKGSGI
jgi:hypothetical protein